jgi:hypothetical protein
LKPGFDRVEIIKFSPAGNILAANVYSSKKDGDEGIAILDLPTGRIVNILKGDVTNLAFSPDRQTLASCHFKRSTITIWDLATGKRLNQIEAGQDKGVIEVTFRPDGKMLAAAPGSAFMILDLETGARWVKELPECSSIVFSPDGRFLATGGPWVEEVNPKGNPMEASAILWDVRFSRVRINFEKDAFETTKQYEDRMAMTEVNLPATPVTLRKEQYNADQGGFEIDFLGNNRLFVPVEVDKAKALLAQGPRTLKLTGKLLYHDRQNLILVDGLIVNSVAGERYQFHKVDKQDATPSADH